MEVLYGSLLTTPHSHAARSKSRTLRARRPYVVATSPDHPRDVAEAEEFFRKICHYRIWHRLEEKSPTFPVLSTEPVRRTTDAVQGLYMPSEDETNVIEGVGSVTLTYPKGAQSWVTQQLAELPPRLSLIQDSSLPSSNKSIHIQGPRGKKSLAVLGHPLEIEVPERSVFISLNNPSDPAWIAALHRDRPPMEGLLVPEVFNEQEVSEQAVWDKTKSWLQDRNFSVEGNAYPNGENSFPDYRARINGQEYHVEISAPYPTWKGGPSGAGSAIWKRS